ncbi:MAG: DUF1844 domain-containing protein [Fimbriimonadaceae bacterium]|nr:DUF1844 domain-containing protein [Chthonomonadaceae bacterium]MCO5297966.1 DUF1844 domain-containing protein [Fimbriimonadaceae bacterium]
MAESHDTPTPEAPEPLSVFSILTFMVDQMAAVAWQKLGLQPDMVTGTIHADLAEAKVAIDVTTHLSTFIEGKLDDEDKRRIHTLVRDLRMNYVQKAKEAQQ